MYRGDQEHWYGPGDHTECRKCGYCKECGFPRGSTGCDLHHKVDTKKDAVDTRQKSGL